MNVAIKQEAFQNVFVHRRSHPKTKIGLKPILG